MKQTAIHYVLGFLIAAVLSGCGGENNVLWKDVELLQQENSELSMQVQTLQAQNTQMARQVDSLSGLKKETRLQTLDTLESIHLNKRTGVYDLDEDGSVETLAVYVEPRDSAQDAVKAVGRLQVALWNLNAEADKARLAEWTLEPAQLHPLWGGNIFSSYYRLTFDVSEVVSTRPEELTVKVTFIDYLSGKVVTAQTVITP